jgi:hypothetical protein
MSQVSTYNQGLGRGRGRPPNIVNDQKLLKKRHHNNNDNNSELLLQPTREEGSGPAEKDQSKRFKVDPEATL